MQAANFFASPPFSTNRPVAAFPPSGPVAVDEPPGGFVVVVAGAPRLATPGGCDPPQPAASTATTATRSAGGAWMTGLVLMAARCVGDRAPRAGATCTLRTRAGTRGTG